MLSKAYRMVRTVLPCAALWRTGPLLGFQDYMSNTPTKTVRSIWGQHIRMAPVPSVVLPIEIYS